MAPFIQLEKREKELRWSNTFSKVAGYLLKVLLLYGCFPRSLNSTNCTKSRKASQDKIAVVLRVSRGCEQYDKRGK